ncbi:hypothetical protein ACFLU6_16615 [Acidobacteriota bacterium]
MVAAVAIPNYYFWSQREKQKQTLVTLRDVSYALFDYKEDHGSLPVCKGCATYYLRKFLEPSYIDVVPLKDAWGRSIQYTASKNSFVLWSLGRDGLPQYFPFGGGSDSFDIDLVFFNRGLWQGPNGLCGGYPREIADPFLLVASELDGVRTPTSPQSRPPVSESPVLEDGRH